MKKYVLIITALLMVSGYGCEFESYRDYQVPSYEGAFTWTRATEHAAWPNRQDFAAAAFKNRLWVFGGYNPGQVSGDTYYEDVWSSSDGVSWDCVLETAPWKGRRGHAVTVFNDGSGEALYLTGGFSVDEETGYRQYNNDVWRSYDGITWTEIHANVEQEKVDSAYWFPRMNHSCVALTQSDTSWLYLIAGSSMIPDHNARYSMIYFSDVWRSNDGENWTRLHNNDFGIRSGQAVAVDSAGGRIYIQGGMHGVIFDAEDNGTHPLPDWHWLWSSSDGVNWIPENDTADFEQGYLFRTEHQMAFINNTLWAFPGAVNSNVHFHFAQESQYTFWRVDQGNLWSVDSKGSDFDARYSYAMVVMNNRVWIMGGDTNAHGPSNDVWYGELE
ncbi:MAG: hypothetical protein ACOYXB_10565 [Bacteroidota bacterium]